MLAAGFAEPFAGPREPAPRRGALPRAAATAIAGLVALAPAPAPQAAPGDTPLAVRLSQAGLYAEGSTTVLRDGLIAFEPQYPLWSDGTRKRRWLQLPPGAGIDASRPDAWSFPPGTRLWKEFSLGRRIETRLLERRADGSWRYAAYVWNAAQTDAELAPAAGRTLAVEGAAQGRYRVPGEADCRACHEGGTVPVLGFSALQLSPDRDPLAPHAGAARGGFADLPSLVAQGRLRGLPLALLDRPPRIAAASAVERAALGYLHGNCGHCHAAGTSDAAVPVELALAQAAVPPPGAAPGWRRMLAAGARTRPARAGTTARLVIPGRSGDSLLVQRMRSRAAHERMPPLGTELPDPEGLALIERWIDQHLPY